jgi:hypothetical protein
MAKGDCSLERFDTSGIEKNCFAIPINLSSLRDENQIAWNLTGTKKSSWFLQCQISKTGFDGEAITCL